jgi:hypothetical protein
MPRLGARVKPQAFSESCHPEVQICLLRWIKQAGIQPVSTKEHTLRRLDGPDRWFAFWAIELK